jgi:hypothetical protein
LLILDTASPAARNADILRQGGAATQRQDRRQSSRPLAKPHRIVPSLNAMQAMRPHWVFYPLV